MLSLILLLPSLAACSVLQSGAPSLLVELRRQKVNVAVLDALYERVFMEEDPEVKVALDQHFRDTFQNSFKDASGWLHLAVTANLGNPNVNLIAAVWDIYEDGYPQVQRILKQEVLPLMALASKLKTAFYINSPKAELTGVKSQLARQNAEMERAINDTLDDFLNTRWRTFLPKRLDAFQKQIKGRLEFANEAVPELHDQLAKVYPFRTFLVISFDKKEPLQICSNGSRTATEDRLEPLGRKWGLVVLSIPRNERVRGNEAVFYFNNVENSDSAFFCESQTEKIFQDMKVPCEKGHTPLVMLVVSMRDHVYYVISESPHKQFKIKFVERSFPAVCKRSYALIALGGELVR